jgi:hypothetical protein
VTDLDDLPFSDGDSGWPPSPVVEREPRKCKRHQWVTVSTHWEERRADGLMYEVYRPGESKTFCANCPAVRNEITSRRGKNSRNRGNAYERTVAAKLGGKRVGQYGDKVDVDVPGYLRIQVKNGTAYPERIDGWLRAIPFQSDRLRAVVIGDAPGPGLTRRGIIVFDLDEYAAYHGKG